MLSNNPLSATLTNPHLRDIPLPAKCEQCNVRLRDGRCDFCPMTGPRAPCQSASNLPHAPGISPQSAACTPTGAPEISAQGAVNTSTHAPGDAPPGASEQSASNAPTPQSAPYARIPNRTRSTKRKTTSHGAERKARKTEPIGVGLNALGANGRPIVLANVSYCVDLQALTEYAASDEAARTKASDDAGEHRSQYTERQVIRKFLAHVERTALGDGKCTVS